MTVHRCVRKRGTFTDRFFSGRYRWQGKSVVAMVERSSHLSARRNSLQLGAPCMSVGLTLNFECCVRVTFNSFSAPGAGRWRKVTVVQMGRCLHRSVLRAFTYERRQFVVQHFSPNWLDLTFDGFLAERMYLHLLWSELPVLLEDLNFVTRPRTYFIST